MHNFRLPKARGGGYFETSFMLATHNKATDSGEFFMEFNEPVYDNKLEECFQAYGVASVNIVTFAQNDGWESAAAALYRVMQTAEREGVYVHQTGACSSAVMARTQAKRDVDTQLKEATAFDEKTQAVLKMSLESIAEKMDQHGEISGKIMEQTSEANQGIQELLKVKLELQQEKDNHENTRRAMQLARDRTEHKLGEKTWAENKKEVEIKMMRDELQHLRLHIDSMTGITSLLQARIQEQATTIDRLGECIEANCALVADVRVELGKRARAN